MKKKIASLLIIIFCCIPLFSFPKFEIDFGATFNFSLARYTFVNSEKYLSSNLGTTLGVSFPIYKNFGAFYSNDYGGRVVNSINSSDNIATFYSLGVNYEWPLTDKSSLRFDLGYSASAIEVADGNYGGGRGLAVNINYSYKLTNRIAVRMALKNNFAWKQREYEYQYPSTYSGMYYIKPPAYTAAGFFTWSTTPAIEVVFLLGKQVPTTGEEN